MIISLTGFMGCGKSSVGRRISELLCCRFADLDDVIETREGCSIAEIFERHGESRFRQIEQDTLKSILDETESCTQSDANVGTAEFQEIDETSDADIVLALGGGAVMTPGSAEMVHEKTICIYLRASVDTLLEHLEGESAKRPMLTAAHSGQSDPSALRHRIESLMALRAATYERTAHHIIDTDGKNIDEIARETIDYTSSSLSRRSFTRN